MKILCGAICFSLLAIVTSDVEETPCTEDQLPCDGGGCIGKGRWCDSFPDCKDESDEMFCASQKNPNPVCLEHHMRCDDGTCIPMGARCDYYKDCPDGSDESPLCGNRSNRRRPDLKRNKSDYKSEAIRKAEAWILSQRDSWGAGTARAVIALFLTNSQRYQDTKEGNIIKKQLAIQTTTLLLGNKTKPISLAKLACSVNSLMATCQDPRSFQGLDLVSRLRIRTDREMFANANIPPIVFLTLCLAGMSTTEDYDYLYVNFNRIQEKIGLESLALMAMSCLAKESDMHSSASLNEEMMAFGQNLTAKFQSLGERAIDVYTTALVIQALNAIGYENWNKNSTLRRLVSFQDSSGSFGDILATYYALPALTGKSLLALKDVNCLSESYGWKVRDPSRQSQKEVKYSLWLGDPVTRTHTMSLMIDCNWTVIDVMKYAAEKNGFFSFHYEETANGPSVYSIASIPNDAEREFQWASYRKSKRATKEPSSEYSPLNLLAMDLRSKPEAGDDVVLWYRNPKLANAS